MDKTGSVLELIEKKAFREKTHLFIFKKSISNLNLFLLGAFTAMDIYNIERNKHEPDFSKFYDFVIDYFNMNRGNKGWADIILSENDYDEVKALESFFELYDRFKSTYSNYK